MKMKKALIASLLLSGFSMVQAEIIWFEPSALDIHPLAIEAHTRSIPASLHHETQPLHFAWSPAQASEGRRPAAGPTGQRQAGALVESRSFWLDVTGADLDRGIALPLSAPGAVVRVSALDASAQVFLTPDRLRLALDGRDPTADFGPDQIATGADMREQGMRVPNNTLAFRLHERSGAGNLMVQIAGLPSDEALVVHVYEPNSPVLARLALPRHNFLSGEVLKFDLDLGQGRQAMNAHSIQAILSSPDASETWPIQTARDGSLSLLIEQAPVSSRATVGQGLYEAHVYIEGNFHGQTIRRDLTLAFNIAPATARFSGQAMRAQGAGGLEIELGIETAAAGRYQLNAEVLGTNARGELEVLGFVQSAAVLDAGGGQISLNIDSDMLSSSGLSAPFEIHNLQLLDQGRMSLLEHRSRAMRIGQ